MFIKALKYDFMFSKTWYLAIAAIMIITAIASKIYAQPRHSQGIIRDTDGLLLAMVVIVAGIISIFQVLIFFNRYLFDDTGRIMLTLPVKRFTLLMSKLVVSIVWFNFMLLIAIISLIVIFDPPGMEFMFMGLSRGISFVNFVALIEVNIMAVSFIVIIFFSTALAYSRLWRRHFHGLAVVTGLASVGLHYWVSNIIFSRHHEAVTSICEHTQSTITSHYNPIIGINVGRIPIGTGRAFFDVYGYGFVIVFIVFMLWVTNYLLKKRVCI